MSFQQPNYSRQGNFFREIPVTKIVIGIWILSFVTGLLSISFFNELLAFIPGQFPSMIIGIVTHSLVAAVSPISLLFAGYMMFQFGGSLERAWGTGRYLLFLAGASATTLVGMQLGFLLFALIKHQPVALQPMTGLWLLVAAITVAWAWLNPEETLLFMFVLPLKAKWIGWITIGLIYIFDGLAITGGPSLLLPIMGLFALSGIGFAYLFVWYQRTWAWIPRKRRSKSSRNIIQHPSGTFMGRLMRPYREWQRRRRVANLSKTIRFDD